MRTRRAPQEVSAMRLRASATGCGVRADGSHSSRCLQQLRPIALHIANGLSYGPADQRILIRRLHQRNRGIRLRSQNIVVVVRHGPPHAANQRFSLMADAAAAKVGTVTR